MLRQLGASDVDFVDPGKTYYTGGYQLAYADATPALQLQARSGRPGPGPRRRRAAQISKDARPSRSRSSRASSSARRSTARSPRRTSSTRSSASCPSRSGGQYPGYFEHHRAGPRSSTDGSAGHLRHRDARTTTRSSSSSRTATGVALASSLVMPITMPVPEDYAGEVRRQDPVDVQHARRRDRPVHGQERRAGQPHRLQAGQVDRRSSATRTGTPRPTTSRPTSTSVNWTTNDTDASLAAQRVLNGSHLVARHQPAGGRARGGRHDRTRTSGSRSRAAAGATSR